MTDTPSNPDPVHSTPTVVPPPIGVPPPTVVPPPIGVPSTPVVPPPTVVPPPENSPANGNPPPENPDLFSHENFSKLSAEQKDQLLIEFAKNNSVLKLENDALESHKKTMEEEKAQYFEEQKKQILDIIKGAGGTVEALEQTLDTFSPTGLDHERQNKMRGTLVAVKNSFGEMAKTHQQLREENEKLKAAALSSKSSDDVEEKFKQMLGSMRNAAPNPARFEPSTPAPEALKKRKIEESESQSSAPVPTDQYQTPVFVLDPAQMRIFNAMKTNLSTGVGHHAPW
jgi:hypothetical protein